MVKERTAKTKELNKYDYKWGQLKEKNYDPHRLVLNNLEIDDKEYFLKMITGVQFEEVNKVEDIIQGLRELKLMATNYKFGHVGYHH